MQRQLSRQQQRQPLLKLRRLQQWQRQSSGRMWRKVPAQGGRSGRRGHHRSARSRRSSKRAWRLMAVMRMRRLAKEQQS
jgi:hypothetical protein